MSFYSGRTMFTGNAVKAWRHLAPDEQYDVSSMSCAGRPSSTAENAGALSRSRSARGAAYRLQSPAALLIVLPNGLVKLINALPFVCGDFSSPELDRDLGQLQTRMAGSACREVHSRSGQRSQSDAHAAPMGSV